MQEHIVRQLIESLLKFHFDPVSYTHLDVYKRQLKDSPTTRVLIHEKSSLAPPGQSLAFSLGDEKGFEWIGAYDITADELLTGTDTAKTESKTAQAQMLILELLADGKRMPSAELEKAVNERGISSRTCLLYTSFSCNEESILYHNRNQSVL